MSIAQTATISLRRLDGTERAAVTVDAEDYERLTDRRWHLTPHGYAVRRAWPNGKQHPPDWFYMHCVVLGADPSQPRLVKHVNDDRLDNRRANLRPAEPRQYPEIEPSLGYWLAGLIDGEGSFGINRRPHSGTFSATFYLVLRSDDRHVLADVHRACGIGTLHVWRARGSPNSRSTCGWIVQSKADCARLAEILDRYPLRTKKARDYEVWRRAVVAWQTIRPRGPRRADWTPLANLKRELEAVRAFCDYDAS